MFGELIQHFQIHLEDGEQIVEVVCNAAGKLAERFHLRCVAQALLQFAADGDIADDTDEIANVAVRHLPDRQIHRKGTAVLTLTEHFTTDADDPGFAGCQVIADIPVMIAPVRFRHEH